MPRLPSDNVISIGVDPGASGGIVFLRGSKPIEICSMPATERDVWDLFSIFAGESTLPARAVIEKVGGFIQGSAQPGSAMFKFGMSYGGLRMALIAAGISFDEVTPQAWQKALGVSKRGKNEAKGAWKNRLKAKAQQLFPSATVTLATADALLLAEYCRRVNSRTSMGRHEEESE